MKRPRRPLARAQDGAAAAEFAIAAPVLILLIIGILQLGLLFLARAGLGQAVEAGARYATIYPRPSDTQISAKVLANGYGMQSGNITGPTLTHGTANGSPYVDIVMTYSITLNFGFYQTSPIQLSYTRRAYQV